MSKKSPPLDNFLNYQTKKSFDENINAEMKNT